MAYWAAAIDAAASFGGAWMNSDSTRANNKTAKQLAKENREFMERMSNTSIQRRKADIIAAGGNPALAFTSGQGASTPQTSPAETEAPQVDVRTNFTGAALAKANINNIQADTTAKLADARAKKVNADLAEAEYNSKKEALVKGNVEDFEQAGLKTRIMRNQVTSSAAEAKRLDETVDAMIRMANQQRETGEINLDALRNIASMGGIEAGAAMKIIQSLATVLLGMKK